MVEEDEGPSDASNTPGAPTPGLTGPLKAGPTFRALLGQNKNPDVPPGGPLSFAYPPSHLRLEDAHSRARKSLQALEEAIFEVSIGSLFLKAAVCIATTQA
jgi:hypothetical protein